MLVKGIFENPLQKVCFPLLHKIVLQYFDNVLTLCHTVPPFNDLEKEVFENIVGKGEKAGNQHFLLFPHCCIPFPNQI